MYSGNDLKKETLIELDGQPYRVVEYAHHAMGRGGGVVRTRIKNLITGSVLERSFRPSDKVTPAEIIRVPAQYLYLQGNELVLMDQSTYEQILISQDFVAGAEKYLPEGTTINLLAFQGKPIGLDLPKNVALQVSHTEQGLRGDTATSATKPAKLETGITVQVPLFINEGDTVKVDTRTGQYLERQK